MDAMQPEARLANPILWDSFLQPMPAPLCLLSQKAEALGQLEDSPATGNHWVSSQRQGTALTAA